MAIHTQGLLAIASGRVAEGLALLDEAMTSVLAGEVSPFFTGVIYCNVIGACLELADVGRAGEWSDAQDLGATPSHRVALPGDVPREPRPRSRGSEAPGMRRRRRRSAPSTSSSRSTR